MQHALRTSSALLPTALANVLTKVLEESGMTTIVANQMLLPCIITKGKYLLAEAKRSSLWICGGFNLP